MRHVENKRKGLNKKHLAREELRTDDDHQDQDLYYNTRAYITKFTPPFRAPIPKPYIRSQYLEECARVSRSGKNPPLQFFVYSREVIYRKKQFANVALNQQNSNNGSRPTMPSDHYIKTHARVKTHATVTDIDKDVILLRGRTLHGGHPVFAFIDYHHDDISPCFYVEAREGFDDATYNELPDVLGTVRPHHLSIAQGFGGSMESSKTHKPTGVDKFVRWLQNFMYHALSPKKNEYGKAHVPKDHLIDPNIIVSYTWLHNVPGAKTMYGYTPDPSEGGPNRSIIKVCATEFDLLTQLRSTLLPKLDA